MLTGVYIVILIWSVTVPESSVTEKLISCDPGVEIILVSSSNVLNSTVLSFQLYVLAPEPPLTSAVNEILSVVRNILVSNGCVILADNTVAAINVSGVQYVFVSINIVSS